MVFPSLFFQNDPGIVSQFTGLVVLVLSFLLKRFRWAFLVAMSFVVFVLAFIGLRVYRIPFLAFVWVMVYP